MFSLNAIGSKILDLLETGHDEAQIAEQLSAACSTDIETVRIDVRGFLETLIKHQILQQHQAALATNTPEASNASSDRT